MKIPAILIDANSFSKGNLREEIEDALSNDDLKFITSDGTRFDDELWRSATQFYISLKRIGAYVSVCANSVTQKTKEINRLGCVTSDDEHVIAVAITSGATVLVSDDKALANDFKNCRAIDQQTKCINNPCLGSKKSRKVVRSTARKRDVLASLGCAQCAARQCPCMHDEGPRC